VHPSLRDGVDKSLDAALAAASISVPCTAADTSVLRLLMGDSSAVGRMVGGQVCPVSSVSAGGDGDSAGGRGAADAGLQVRGARGMLLHALVHNVQFDWKAAFKNRAAGEDGKSDECASLLVSAMREFAMCHAAGQHGGPHDARESERSRSGGRAGAAGREGEAFGSGGGGTAEDVEATAAGVMLEQARRQAEADLLLLCCHRTSTLLGSAPVPLCNQHAPKKGEEAHHGWWLQPSAVKSRALARLLRTSASKSPRAHQLLCRVEEAVRQLGERESVRCAKQARSAAEGQEQGAGVEGGADAAAEPDGPSMLDICLWALVLSDAEPASQPLGEQGREEWGREHGREELGVEREGRQQRGQQRDSIGGLSGPFRELDSFLGARGCLSQEAVVLRLVNALVHVKVLCM